MPGLDGRRGRALSVAAAKGARMSYRTHCDWCGTHLAHEDDQAVMPVTVYHRRGKGALDAKWAEETGVTRHFCAHARDEDLTEAGRQASCYERAIAAVRGTPLSDPGMGMEWRMMPVAGEQPDVSAVVASKVPAPGAELDDPVAFAETHVTRELHDVILRRLPASKRYVLPRCGIVSLDQVAVMSDDELLAIDGIGHRTLMLLREAVDDRMGFDGLTLARQVYALLEAGLPRLGEEDPMHLLLAGTMPTFAAALGQAQEVGEGPPAVG